MAKELEELARSHPQAGAAASAIGKTVFASRGLWGRSGAHARRPLYAALQRLHTGPLDRWPPEVIVALHLWARLLRCGRPRMVPLHPGRSPAAVLYGDAALSSRRAAAAVWTGDGRPPLAFSVVLPNNILEGLGPSPEHAINGAEVWWIVKALETWGEKLRGHNVLCFGDNQAAIAGCIAGYSGSVHVARLVGMVHQLLCEHDIACYFEWVHTLSNPLDGGSRSGWLGSLRRLGAEVIDVSPLLRTNLSDVHPV